VSLVHIVGQNALDVKWSLTCRFVGELSFVLYPDGGLSLAGLKRPDVLFQTDRVHPDEPIVEARDLFALLGNDGMGEFQSHLAWSV
jgi:hypothetical protein